MSGPPDYSGNPFVPQAEPGFVPAPDPGGLLSRVRRSDPYPQGILLSPQEQAALAAAPQRPTGTEVQVRDTPVEASGGLGKHMFVHFDDGQTQLVARGGPTENLGLGFLTPRNRVAAEVTPEATSKDHGEPYSTLATTFLPGVTADQAAAPARGHGLGVDHLGNACKIFTQNSNSYAADVAESVFGQRPGNLQTPGYKTHLRDDGAPPPSMSSQISDILSQLPDLSPALRSPFG